ncbi:hypothetical protein V1506DRAFT_532231 [Lipomyces tetrasporus]
MHAFCFALRIILYSNVIAGDILHSICHSRLISCFDFAAQISALSCTSHVSKKLTFPAPQSSIIPREQPNGGTSTTQS